jgi:hypothetical protein
MKQIQPVSIWYNGQIYQATIFNLLSAFDNLVDTCYFTYFLYDNQDFQLATGSLTLTGADYTTYSSSPDSNSYAYQWGATQLNLTLV